MDIRNGNILAYLCATILLCSQNVIASEDNYLNLLEAEAESSRLDSGEKDNKRRSKHHVAINVENKDWLGECGSIDGVLPSNIGQEKFSSYLEQCSMTTFSLYRRLDSDSQQSVYKSYASTVSLKVSELRKKIFKRY